MGEVCEVVVVCAVDDGDGFGAGHGVVEFLAVSKGNEGVVATVNDLGGARELGGDFE